MQSFILLQRGILTPWEALINANFPPQTKENKRNTKDPSWVIC